MWRKLPDHMHDTDAALELASCDSVASDAFG